MRPKDSLDGNPVSLQIVGETAVISIDNPPVNAISHAVRAGLVECIEEVDRDPKIKAVLIICEGKTFFSGADISEFETGMKAPLLPYVILQLENLKVPVVAAIHGQALGGGLEIALGAHFRIAEATAKLGLPEIKLGIIPGAGGTQRLPRLINMQDAAKLITTGTPISAKAAAEMGLVDFIAETGSVREAGLSFCQQLIARNVQPRRASELPCHQVTTGQLKDSNKPSEASMARDAALEALRYASSTPFAEGMAHERKLVRSLLASDQSRALRYAFFAERAAAKLPQIDGVPTRKVVNIGIVGGGTMGTGIAVSALMAGLSVTLAELTEEAATKAFSVVEAQLAGAVKRGKLTPSQRDKILKGLFKTVSDLSALKGVDLIIEAVFEDMAIKKGVLASLDKICGPETILATNTSYLDVNEIAAATTRPGDVIGLHFFSPAHIMRLLELVVADQSKPEVVATGIALAKRMAKIPVRSGVCDGFIGNRILSHYTKAMHGVVLGGASPFEVDRALTDFGLAMGPYAVSDLGGLDIGRANRQRLSADRDPREIYPHFADRLCELKRLGRKTGRGFYIYDDTSPAGRPDPEVEDILAAERQSKGITPRDFSADEITNRYICALINEAARVVGDKIAQRPLDVDVVLLNGYGFPRWRGGPMFYADQVGLEKILTEIQVYAEDDPFFWQPAPLLEELVAKGQTFQDLNEEGGAS